MGSDETPEKTQSQMYAYCDCLQVGPREQLTKDRAFDHAFECPRIQQRSSPEVAQL
jgi:hypothetical protein